MMNASRFLRRLTLPALAVAALLLAGCAPDTGPMWKPDSPRNGAGQPVDPIYGTPIPGYPAPNSP